MKNRDEIKSILQKHIDDFKKNYHVKSLGIFGSYSRGDCTQDSDIDIVVEFEEPIGLEFVDLADQLELMLESKVDLVSRNAIKPKYWEFIKEDVLYV